MAASTIVIPNRDRIASYSPALAQAFIDAMTQAKADIDALTGGGKGAEWAKNTPDAAASTTLAEHVFYEARTATTISAIDFAADAALTADGSNNATITIRKRDGAGGSSSTIATLTTDVAGGSWTQFVKKSLGAITNGTLIVGDLLTIQIAKTGTGVVVPAGLLTVQSALT